MPARGSGKLSVVIREQIQSVQYDQPEIADCWEVFGTVQCKVCDSLVTSMFDHLLYNDVLAGRTRG